MHDKKPVTPPAILQEQIDYYIENGRWVFTAHFLRNRGYCCQSGCRHCPYGFVRPADKDHAHSSPS